ncbi:helix-turn-helix domain-containing protein [Vagococcus zengguangii]|uniref:Helix-turn-helix domain-containing protein n=1 Tax=Vagococcus zengguangii TaxID=2571750 RepID=A0A4D7CT99_9ENTE|nr:RodZ domain-containing protein [Vagococcus zengguangii]QCI85707.1 helix-turn-helix domain-containing protein [Vagococcus zengguangii]TLG81649.1 DUF4115 domain-containing protein [Vagococcus zengguangii]
METIGERLRKARLSKGITIEDLQKMTKIQARYLSAVEDNQFELLPGTYYARNFIRQYAQAVGLDDEELIKLYENGGEAINPVGESAGASRTELNRRKHRTSNISKDRWPMILLSLASLLIIATVFWLTLRQSNPKQVIKPNDNVVVEGSFEESTDKPDKNKETASSESKEATREEESSESKEKEELKTTIDIGEEIGRDTEIAVKSSEKQATVKIKSTGGRCWIGITADGQSAYNATVEANQEAEVKLDENVKNAVITLGAANAVELFVNGEKVDFNKTGTNLDMRNLNLALSYLDKEND